MSISSDFLAQIKESLDIKQQKYAEFYPDTIPFTYDAKEYQAVWRNLIAGSKKSPHIYVSGYELKPVSRTRYLWEAFRGKLGLENHCSPARVKMGLQKLLYYGYVNKFENASAEELPIVKTELRAQLAILKQPYSENSVKKLQDELTNTYLYGVSSLRPSWWKRTFSFKSEGLSTPGMAGFEFGDSLIALAEKACESARLNILHLYGRLQPKFINRHAQYLVNSLSPMQMSRTIPPNTILAKSIAAHYMRKAEEGLRVYSQPENSKGVVQTYIVEPIKKLLGSAQNEVQYYFDWNYWSGYALVASKLDADVMMEHLPRFAEFELSRRNYDEAARLILQIKNIDIQYRIITANPVHEKELIAKLPKDCEVAIRLAQKYIAVNDMPTADKLASPNLNPQKYFHFYVENNRYDEAYQLYCNTNDYAAFEKDNSKNLRKLAETFSQLSNERQVDKVIDFKRTLRHKKKSMRLQPDNRDYKKDVQIHRRCYGQTLFKENQLDKAIAKYEKCMAQEAHMFDRELISHYKAALDQRIKRSLEGCLDPLSTSHPACASLDHQQKCSAYILQAESDLNKMINLLGEKADKRELAKYYFKLGDLQQYFDRAKSYDALEKAVQLAPTNPFYGVHYYQLVGNSEKYQEFYDLFGVYDNLNAQMFDQWKSERWHKKKIFSLEFKEIHEYDNPPKSFFSNFFN